MKNRASLPCEGRGVLKPVTAANLSSLSGLSPLSPSSLPSRGDRGSLPLSPLPPERGRGERGETPLGPTSPPGFQPLYPLSPRRGETQGEGEGRGERGETLPGLAPLSLVRQIVAPLLHPESLWSYLWTDADSQRVSDVLDDAFGYPPGSGLWPLDQLAAGEPLFTFGQDHGSHCYEKGKAWILGARPRGTKGQWGEKIAGSVWIQPKAPPRFYAQMPMRFVTLKAWRAAHDRAHTLEFNRKVAINVLLLRYLNDQPLGEEATC